MNGIRIAMLTVATLTCAGIVRLSDHHIKSDRKDTYAIMIIHKWLGVVGAFGGLFLLWIEIT